MIPRKNLIITAPMRFVRTAKDNGEVIQPKSRISAHLDPQVGRTYRADAATTSWVATQVSVTLAASAGMSGETLDVSASFLSGMPLEKWILVRAPSNGSLDRFSMARTYGVTQALRLLFLRSHGRLTEPVAMTVPSPANVIFFHPTDLRSFLLAFLSFSLWMIFSTSIITCFRVLDLWPVVSFFEVVSLWASSGRKEIQQDGDHTCLSEVICVDIFQIPDVFFPLLVSGLHVFERLCHFRPSNTIPRPVDILGSLLLALNESFPVTFKIHATPCNLDVCQQCAPLCTEYADHTVHLAVLRPTVVQFPPASTPASRRSRHPNCHRRHHACNAFRHCVREKVTCEVYCLNTRRSQ